MNERIKELAEQAHEYTDQVISSSGWSNGDEIFEEKFAELIVQECAELVDRAISDGGVDGGVLKQHFGIS